MERLLGFRFEPGHTLIAPHIGSAANNHGSIQDTLSIIHAGKIDWGRSALPFLQAFSTAIKARPQMRDSIRLTFFGSVDDSSKAIIETLGLSDVVRFEGFVPYDQSLSIMSGATSLLLIEAVSEDGIFLPSKFCDYVVSGKPLLLFSPKNGTIADIVGKDHPSLLGQKEPEVVAGLIRFFDDWQQGEDVGRYVYHGREHFSGKRIVSEILGHPALQNDRPEEHLAKAV
jgi:glycosyltransferase involved in cell wall biosynthesis